MIDRTWFWYLALAIWIGFIAAVCLLPIGDCVSLNISGNITGQGTQNLSYAGDLLNVSILENTFGCSWNITGALP